MSWMVTLMRNGRLVIGRRHQGAFTIVLSSCLAFLLLTGQKPVTAQAAGVSFGAPVVAVPFPAGATLADPYPPSVCATAPGVCLGKAFSQSEPQLLQLKDGRLALAAQFEMWNCVTGQPLKDDGGLQDGSTGTSGQRPCIWASGDNGQTFHLSGGECCQNGDDVSLVQTPDSGTILETFMSNVGPGAGTPGTSLSRTTDGGKTWQERVAYDGQLVQDRPFTIAESETNVVTTFTGAPGNIFVVRSHNQGSTWEPAQVVTPTPPNPALSINGEPALDSTRREIVLSYVGSDQTGGGSANDGNFDVVSVARSHDHGATWTNERVAVLPAGQGVVGIPTLSSDAVGNEYLSYFARVGGHGVGAFLVTSTADGVWSAPRRVDPPGGSAMLSTVRATGNGHLVIAYYHANNGDAYDRTQDWTVDSAVSYDAGATFITAPVSGHAVYFGSFLDHQVNIFDMTAVNIDPTGRIEVAWTDNGAANPPNGRNTIQFARQTDASLL